MADPCFSMSLNELVMADNPDWQDISVTDLAVDSRKVTPGCVFFAYPGTQNDGREYLMAAQEAGAVAVLYEDDGYPLPSELVIPAIGINQLQYQAGFLADRFFASPSEKMQIFAVTGTNGKSTTCYLLAQAFTALGLQTAIMGTLGNGPLNDLNSTGLTTPDPISLHRQLAQWQAQGITQVCMEVSSHALDQGRINGVQVYCALFSNLTHDHLDYHGDMQSYLLAKQKLFTEFNPELVVINADDPAGLAILEQTSAEFVVTFGEGADVEVEEVVWTSSGMQLEIAGNGVDFSVHSNLVGKVNVPNIAMLVACLLSLSVSLEDIQAIVAELRSVPGRMELITATGKPKVVVDYAHTPDALQKAIESLRIHCQGQLWCVFGCGGDRDRDKRPLMGQIASESCDRVIVTSDNPRHEPQQQIFADIQAGIDGKFEVEVIADRQQAIETAIAKAASEDWILVAGKGHETTQQIDDQVLSFSDQAVVQACMEVAA